MAGTCGFRLPGRKTRRLTETIFHLPRLSMGPRRASRAVFQVCSWRSFSPQSAIRFLCGALATAPCFIRPSTDHFASSGVPAILGPHPLEGGCSSLRLSHQAVKALLPAPRRSFSRSLFGHSGSAPRLSWLHRKFRRYSHSRKCSESVSVVITCIECAKCMPNN